MANHVNILKLCVGTETVEDLIAWQSSRAALSPDGLPYHVTRMWPKRQAEVLAGGSLYWIFKGMILARQPILRLQEAMGSDGIMRCAIVLDPKIIRTEPVARRAFQGWRYLAPDDSPRDLAAPRAGDDSLPPDLAAELADIGLL